MSSVEQLVSPPAKNMAELIKEDKNRLLQMIDAKTKLAGSNRMEVLLFRLDGNETFGINVFKVCEVSPVMPITRAPNMRPGVVGMMSMRGTIIPVIDLGYFLGQPVTQPAQMLITEFSGHVQSFLVGPVDRIVRVDWADVKSYDNVFGDAQSMVTAVTELADQSLVSIIDVEQVLHDALGEEITPPDDLVKVTSKKSVFFVDDSSLARKRIGQIMESMGVQADSASNGRIGWQRLEEMAARAQEGHDAMPGLILVDAEMPEVDGYMLTRLIKGDRRFDGIPVVMHSSLSSVANRTMGEKVGVDAYIAKFDSHQFSECVRRFLDSGA